MTDERTAILFLAHQDDPEVFEEFRNLKASCAASYDVFLIFHQADEHAPRVLADLEKDLFAVTGQDIQALNLPYYAPKNSNLVVYEGGQIYFGNADFLQLCFFPRTAAMINIGASSMTSGSPAPGGNSSTPSRRRRRTC